MGRIASETAKGLKWGIIQKFTMQPIQFLYGIILARLLAPEEMGILALTSIFFAIAGQLQNCGFGTALIRKQDRTHADICTVFWYNVGMSALLSGCIFFSAPWIADFYHEPALLNLTRVAAGMMFLNSTVSVHSTLFQAHRNFKTPAIVGMIATLLPMPFTIWAAYSGWSYWSLMVQSILSGFLNLILIWRLSPWKPSLIWSWDSFRSFFGFGIKLVGSGIITTTYSELRTFIIGKFYSPAQLAFFSRGYHISQMPMNMVLGLLGNVTYPILATLQHDRSKLLSVYRRYIRLTSLVMVWLMLTCAFNSRALILTLYGAKWENAAIYAGLLCFGIVLDPLTHINVGLWNVYGRPDCVLKKEVIIRCWGIPAMLVGAYYSVTGICYAALSVSVLSFVIAVVLTTRLCELKIRYQMLDFLPYVFMALAANVPSFFFNDAVGLMPPYLCLICGGLSSFTLYVIFLRLKKDSEALYLLNMFLHTKAGRRVSRVIPARFLQNLGKP